MTNHGTQPVAPIAPVYAAIYAVMNEAPMALPIVALHGQTPCVLDQDGRLRHIRNSPVGDLIAVLPIAEANALVIKRDAELDAAWEAEHGPFPEGSVNHLPPPLVTYPLSA